MKTMRVLATTLALGTTVAVAPGIASAEKGHPRHHKEHQKTAKPAATHATKYVFRGVVMSAPGASATALPVQIRSGNPAALRLLGSTNPINTSFLVAATTQLFSWNAAGTASTQALTANMLAGDPVAVTIFGPANATLASLMATPASRVDDVLNSTKPAGRMFIFVGKVVSTDAVSALTINVTGGNWRAMFALKGQQPLQTFHFAPTTVFLHWNHKGNAQLITPAAFHAGDTVTVRVFSSNFDSQLSTLLATPAWLINNHEPQALVQRDIRHHNDHKL